MIKFKPYPKHDEIRVGINVSWYYYKSESDAKICAEAAKHNAKIQIAAGYDFGYQSPGSITAPQHQNFHPGMWEVCIP